MRSGLHTAEVACDMSFAKDLLTDGEARLGDSFDMALTMTQQPHQAASLTKAKTACEHADLETHENVCACSGPPHRWECLGPARVPTHARNLTGTAWISLSLPGRSMVAGSSVTGADLPIAQR